MCSQLGAVVGNGDFQGPLRVAVGRWWTRVGTESPATTSVLFLSQDSALPTAQLDSAPPQRRDGPLASLRVMGAPVISAGHSPLGCATLLGEVRPVSCPWCLDVLSWRGDRGRGWGGGWVRSSFLSAHCSQPIPFFWVYLFQPHGEAKPLAMQPTSQTHPTVCTAHRDTRRHIQ
jgi:hypothetical protein